jgi:hypothetical protein
MYPVRLCPLSPPTLSISTIIIIIIFYIIIYYVLYCEDGECVSVIFLYILHTPRGLCGMLDLQGKQKEKIQPRKSFIFGTFQVGKK